VLKNGKRQHSYFKHKQHHKGCRGHGKYYQHHYNWNRQPDERCNHQNDIKEDYETLPLGNLSHFSPDRKFQYSDEKGGKNNF
jgi:hypothetical protein